MKLLKSRPKELKGLKPSLVKKDVEYVYSKIEFYIKGNNLYIKLTGHGTRWFVLENYSKYTALEVINMVSWGRHFEDGILLLWENEGLRFGWLEN